LSSFSFSLIEEEEPLPDLCIFTGFVYYQSKENQVFVSNEYVYTMRNNIYMCVNII